MCTRHELLEAAAGRGLVVLIKYVDRAHVVWLGADGSTVDATRRDCGQVQGLMLDGLLQQGELAEHVEHQGEDQLVARILPTEAGLTLLKRLRDQAALAAFAIGGAA